MGAQVGSGFYKLFLSGHVVDSTAMLGRIPAIVALLVHAAAGARKRSVSRHNSSACPPVTTQPGFDLTTFISARWYVRREMTLEYSPVDGHNCANAFYEIKESPEFWGWTITVKNRAMFDNGTAFGGDLCAIAADSNDAAKLKVAPCFLPTFLGGPYWVLKYDEAEGYAVISGGQPTVETPDGCQTGTGTNDSGLWIFTRKSNPAPEVVEKGLAVAAEKGFDLGVLSPVSHSNCEGIEGY